MKLKPAHIYIFVIIYNEVRREIISWKRVHCYDARVCAYDWKGTIVREVRNKCHYEIARRKYDTAFENATKTKIKIKTRIHVCVCVCVIRAFPENSCDPEQRNSPVLGSFFLVFLFNPHLSFFSSPLFCPSLSLSRTRKHEFVNQSSRQYATPNFYRTIVCDSLTGHNKIYRVLLQFTFVDYYHLILVRLAYTYQQQVFSA